MRVTRALTALFLLPVALAAPKAIVPARATPPATAPRPVPANTAGGAEPAELPPGGTYHPLPSATAFDTRTGLNVPRGRTADVTVHIAGLGGVPATGVSTVVLNVLVVNAATPGSLTVGATVATVVSFPAHLPTSETTFAPVEDDGTVGFHSSVAVDVVGQVEGYVSTAAAAGQSGRFTPVVPHRLLDTTTGLPMRPGGKRAVLVTGNGVPTSGVTTVVVNIADLVPTAEDKLTVYPMNTRTPALPTLYDARGQRIANRILVPVGEGGHITVYNDANATTDVAVDIVGYFSSASTGEFYVPMGTLGGDRLDPAPGVGARLLTRGRNGYQQHTRQILISNARCRHGGTSGFACDASGGDPYLPGPNSLVRPDVVVGPTSVTAPATSGHVTVWDGSSPQPPTGDVYYARGGDSTDLDFVRLATDGSETLGWHDGAPDVEAAVTIWVSGFFAAAPPDPTPTGTYLTSHPEQLLPPELRQSGDPATSIAYPWNYDEIVDGRAYSSGNPDFTGRQPVPGTPADLVQVVATSMRPAALAADGSVWLWRYQNGSETTAYQQTGLSDVVQLAAGAGGATFALESDGTVWAWGSDQGGGLGDGRSGPSSDVPVQVPGLTGIVSIAAYYFTAAAVDSSGDASWWGTTYAGLIAPTAIGDPCGSTGGAVHDQAGYGNLPVELCGDHTVHIWNATGNAFVAVIGIPAVASLAGDGRGTFSFIDVAGDVWRYGSGTIWKRVYGLHNVAEAWAFSIHEWSSVRS